MAQHWEIRPDGTGQFTDTGPFGYPQSETRLEWRQSEDFHFKIRLTHYIAFQPEYEFDLNDEDRAWHSIYYDFIPISLEFGIKGIGLVGGLLSEQNPLSYCGPWSMPG